MSPAASRRRNQELVIVVVADDDDQHAIVPQPRLQPADGGQVVRVKPALSAEDLPKFPGSGGEPEDEPASASDSPDDQIVASDNLEAVYVHSSDEDMAAKVPMPRPSLCVQPPLGYSDVLEAVRDVKPVALNEQTKIQKEASLKHRIRGKRSTGNWNSTHAIRM